MKKIAMLLSATAIVAITLVSCSKKGDYSCACTVTAAGQTLTTSIPFTDVKKSYAEDQCKAAQVTYTSAGATASCNLQ